MTLRLPGLSLVAVGALLHAHVFHVCVRRVGLQLDIRAWRGACPWNHGQK